MDVISGDKLFTHFIIAYMILSFFVSIQFYSLANANSLSVILLTLGDDNEMTLSIRWLYCTEVVRSAIIRSIRQSTRARQIRTIRRLTMVTRNS